MTDSQNNDVAKTGLKEAVFPYCAEGYVLPGGKPFIEDEKKTDVPATTGPVILCAPSA